MVDALERLDGYRPLTYKQLCALVQSQKAIIDQYSPYGHPRPSIGALPRQRLGNLRTPMQDRPTQQAYDTTRDAAHALASQPRCSSSGKNPPGGEFTCLPP